MAKSSRHGLGKGLDALLQGASVGGAPGAGGNAPRSVGSNADSGAGVVELKVDPALLLPNPHQPRREFNEEALRELADSIREHGVIQPVIVEQTDDGAYFIVAGERRTRAARLAGLSEIPVVVRKYSDERKLEIALIENIQREDLNPLEEAEAYHELMVLENLSQEEAAARVGKSRPAVANALRLLKLPDDMRAALKDGRISPGHARAILSTVNPSDQQVLFARILDASLSVRESEALASELNGGGRAAKKNRPGKERGASSREGPRDADLAALQEKLIELLGTKVTLKGDASKGVLEIAYFSSDDLNRLFEIFSKNSAV